MKCWSSIISSHWCGKLCKLKNEMHFCRSSRGYCGRRKHFYKRSCFQKWRFDSVGVSSATSRQGQFLTSLENQFDHSQSRHTARRCQVGHCCWCLKAVLPATCRDFYLSSIECNPVTERESVKTERKGRDAVSWLLMARANSRDSGIYSCSVDNRSEAIVSVHVIQGAVFNNLLNN